jgi:hypothetical protein
MWLPSQGIADLHHVRTTSRPNPRRNDGGEGSSNRAQCRGVFGCAAAANDDDDTAAPSASGKGAPSSYAYIPLQHCKSRGFRELKKNLTYGV